MSYKVGIPKYSEVANGGVLEYLLLQNTSVGCFSNQALGLQLY